MIPGVIHSFFHLLQNFFRHLNSPTPSVCPAPASSNLAVVKKTSRVLVIKAGLAGQSALNSAVFGIMDGWGETI